MMLVLSFSSTAADNYIHYHKDIIRCEEQFLYNDDIPAALQAYQKVFSKYKRPFAKDCFTALQLAAYTRDVRYSELFMTLCFQHGVDIAALQRSVWVSRLMADDTAFRNKVSAAYPTLHARYGNTLDSNMRRRIIGLKHRDDSFKARVQGQPVNSPQLAEREQAYRTVLNEQTMELVTLIKKQGYPGDAIIGFMDYGFDDETQRIEHCYTLRSLTDQLFYHQSCCYLLLQTQMQQALDNGLVPPSMYALYHDWAFQHLKTGHEDIALCRDASRADTACYNMPTALKPWERHPDTAYVNRCRATIGLASLQHTQQKEAYAKAHDMQLLFGMFRAY